jgi:glyoxylase-like metal-dependent hydrolase (beta-lactamase superfamily II)
VQVRELAEGLWRWTAPHPDWTPDQGKPGGWEQSVGCVYHEAPDAIVLVDPLVPPEDTPEAERLWSALDRDVRRSGLPVVVLIANRFHGRSARRVYQRFAGRVGAEVLVPAGAEGQVACQPTRTFAPGERLPGGVEARFVAGPVEPEVAFHLPRHRALIVADAVLGAGSGRARVAPPSWADATEEGRKHDDALFRRSLRGLLDLDFELLLTSHGEPVLGSGRDALARALDAPAWGEE